MDIGEEDEQKREEKYGIYLINFVTLLLLFIKESEIYHYPNY